ncbi:MAG: PAS domain-containing protein [Chitinophagaceae bacterium]|nr:PAS domain-containing protein [Chitinophagaceae bacterium]
MHAQPHFIKSGDLYEKLNDSSIDRVMAIDEDWRIIAWNKTSELATGRLKDELIGKHLIEEFPQINNDTEMIQAIENAFSGLKSFLPVKTGFFNRQYLENHFIPLRENNGKVLGVMNIIHDVSHRIKAEKQLAKLNEELEKNYSQLEKANNDLANFAYITGRDIKEPIRKIYTSIELLVRQEGHLLSNYSRGNLRKMQASLTKMNLLLDDMLAVSGITSYKRPFHPVDLNGIINLIKTKIEEKFPGLKSRLHAEELPVVNGSDELLSYLFEQIIGNALKFQVNDAEAVIDIKSAQTTRNSEPYYEISIRDNGIGFDEKESERIFEMFVKLNENQYRGTGVGLAVSKKIMELHKGSILAKSQPGNGSTFLCYFPVPEE